MFLLAEMTGLSMMLGGRPAWGLVQQGFAAANEAG
jgi:hypothetical protein